jgi:hypothetical protein
LKNKIFILFFFLCIKYSFAQFDRLPISLNLEGNVPISLANKLFVRSFTGNLDWNANFSYHKKKYEIGLVYRRTNFKAGYKYKAYNTAIKTKFIINSYGVRLMYTFFDNAYFYTQIGATTYYSYGLYNNITFKEIPQPNVKFNFFTIEPSICINYKASKYVDVGFQVSNSIATLRYNPSIANLDETNKIDFSDIGSDNGLTNFLSFGFTFKWYLQFEKSDL